MKDRPCKYGNHYNDWVPIPFGSGNCAMPGFECMYEGDLMILDDCEENVQCPAYEPVETKICPKHDEEYESKYGCNTCMSEEDARQEALMAVIEYNAQEDKEMRAELEDEETTL
jgi:hypothetical protein